MRTARKPDTKKLESQRLKDESNRIKTAIQSLIIRKTLGASILMNERSRIS